MKGIPVSVYRGGTSRALFFHADDLPTSVAEQDQILLDAMGSGSNLQVDGLGGGNPLTSKCVIVSEPLVSEAALSYTFLYPSVQSRIVDRKGNCGNIASAVGPFAVDNGIINASSDSTSLILHNTNTQELLRATFATYNGRFMAEGDFRIGGIPGSGSCIELEFLQTPGNSILPTGQPVDYLEIPELGKVIPVSIIAVGNTTVFCRMEDLGIVGEPADWKNDRGIWHKMEAVRAAGAVRLGLVDHYQNARKMTPAVPKVAAVQSPKDYIDLNGHQQQRDNYQLRVLMSAMGQMHEAAGAAASVATAVAAVIPETVVHAARQGSGSEVRIGHPSGLLDTCAEVRQTNGQYELKSASICRTARLILKGEVFLPSALRSKGFGQKT